MQYPCLEEVNQLKKKLRKPNVDRVICLYIVIGGKGTGDCCNN